MIKPKTDWNYLWIAIGGLLLFVPFLGSVHLFDWDEINFAEAAREMIVSRNYSRVQINFQPFWEKPPLFIWLQVLSMKCFGINEFAARLPNAMVGVFTLLLIYEIGKRIFAIAFGFTWVLVWCGSFLPQFYFRSGIIDPLFNLLIFSSLLCLIKTIDLKQNSLDRSSKLFAAGTGIFIGLATLAKGPVAILILGLVYIIYFFLNRNKLKFFYPEYLISIACALLIISFWFLPETFKNGTWFIAEFFSYQWRLLSSGSEGHAEPFYYHFIVILIGCFPAVIFFIDSFFKSKNELNDVQKNFFQYMLILFFVVLIVFSLVKTKIVHYSSLTYLPLTFIASWSIKEIVHQKKWPAFSKSIWFSLTTIWILVLILIPVFGNRTEWITSFIHDNFTQGNLKSNVHWSVFDFLPAFFLSIGCLAFLFFISAEKIKKAMMTLFLFSILSFQIVDIRFVPKIEMYSQQAAIDFYKAVAGKDCYVFPYNFKSYAHLFYTERKMDYHEYAKNMNWLLTGPIDKATFFVCRKGNEPFKQYNGVKKFAEKNGFVFYYRLPAGL